nr:MAG TPA: hypothetical protein [Caudoviricetes sp.]
MLNLFTRYSIAHYSELVKLFLRIFLNFFCKHLERLFYR